MSDVQRVTGSLIHMCTLRQDGSVDGAEVTVVPNEVYELQLLLPVGVVTSDRLAVMTIDASKIGYDEPDIDVITSGFSEAHGAIVLQYKAKAKRAAPSCAHLLRALAAYANNCGLPAVVSIYCVVNDMVPVQPPVMQAPTAVGSLRADVSGLAQAVADKAAASVHVITSGVENGDPTIIAGVLAVIAIFDALTEKISHGSANQHQYNNSDPTERGDEPAQPA